MCLHFLKLNENFHRELVPYSFHWLMELYVKSLKDEQMHGFDPPFKKNSIKSSLARRVSDPSLGLGETFGTSFFNLSNFEENIGFKIGYAHGICNPKSHNDLCKASLAHPC